MQLDSPPVERVIGLDAHPDSFTAAIVRGPTPSAAIVEKVYNQLPLSGLAKWAKAHLAPTDLVVLEASGNSFHLVRLLQGAGVRAKVLESCQMGKLKEAHANNDKISAIRIGKAYLAGTAKEVWVPDPKTQERRDWFHAHRKATKRTTQSHNRLDSYLSDHGVRLALEDASPQVQEKAAQARPWTPREGQVIEGYFLEWRHAIEQRDHWRSLIAQEVLADPLLLSLVRLCGAREMVAFALGAFVGDIERFPNPKTLVKYVGLNPAFDHSGKGQWNGGIGGHGHSHLRCLLIEAAQAIMRSAHSPLGKWGRKLWAKKSAYNLAVAAVARKLTVAIWYLMKGRWTAVEEIDARLSQKVGKIINQIGKEQIKKLNKTRKEYRQEAYTCLKQGRTYVMKPDRKTSAPPGPSGAAPQPA